LSQVRKLVALNAGVTLAEERSEATSVHSHDLLDVGKKLFIRYPPPLISSQGTWIDGEFRSEMLLTQTM
jgi:hypothetical protein